MAVRPKLTVPINGGAGGGGSGPLKKKVYEKIGQDKITLEQKIQDLKNWFYEDSGKYTLLDVPNWDDLNTSNISIWLYNGLSNPTTIEFYQSGSYKRIRIYDAVTYEIDNEENQWYNIGTNQQVNTPDCVFEEDYIIEEYRELFNAVCVPEKTLLKEKFEAIESALGIEIDTILKNKIYDYSGELTNNKSYKFKSDLSDFFTKYSEAESTLIYSMAAEDNMEEETPQLNATRSGTKGGSSQASNDLSSQEIIYRISYFYVAVEEQQPSLAKGNRTLIPRYCIKAESIQGGEYYYFEDNDGWVRDKNGTYVQAELPALNYQVGFVKNMDMIKDILLLPKTLGEKFEEPIKDWNYGKGGSITKPIYNIEPIFDINYLIMLMQQQLIPMENGNVSTTVYEDDDLQIDFNTYYQQSGANVEIGITIGWKLLSKNEWYKCEIVATPDNLTGGVNSTFEWSKTIVPDDYMQGDLLIFEAVSSQDELPSVAIDEENIAQGINPSVVTSLIGEFTENVTLEQKINDLKNWTYETKEVQGNKYKPVFDINGMLINAENYNTLDQAGIFDEQEDTLLYQDSKVSVYWTKHSSGSTLTWNVTNDDNALVHYINNVYVSPVTQQTMNDWEFSLDNTNSTTAIESEEELPIVELDSTNITSGFEDAFALFVQSVPDIIDVSLKAKIEAGVSLVILDSVTIPYSAINTANTNSYSTYGYIWKVTIQDDALKAAIKVDTIFDLVQIAPENICPFQDIDVESGTLTLYVKENNANIVIERIDIFRYNK